MDKGIHHNQFTKVKMKKYLWREESNYIQEETTLDLMKLEGNKEVIEETGYPSLNLLLKRKKEKVKQKMLAPKLSQIINLMSNAFKQILEGILKNNTNKLNIEEAKMKINNKFLRYIIINNTKAN